MNEVVRDAIGALILGRDLVALDGAEGAAVRIGEPRSIRRRLASLARRDDGRRALARIATELLGHSEVHRWSDDALVDRLVDAVCDGQLGLQSHREHAGLATLPAPRILRESGRTPSAPKAKNDPAPSVAAPVAPPPKSGKKWPPDPVVAPEYPHMAKLEAQAIEQARVAIDVALDLFLFKGLEPVPKPEVPEEFPILAKVEADALRDLAASLNAGLDSLRFTRLAAAPANAPKAAPTE
jgi:hypothetical protein